MFTTKDVTDHAREVVIGPTVAENLFSGTSPVGQTIRVNGTSFTVVGVTASKGSDGTSDQDDVVLAPLTAVQDTLTGYGEPELDHRPGDLGGHARRRAGRGRVDPLRPQGRHRHLQPGLQRDQPGLGARGLERQRPRVHDAARRGRRDLAARRRDRRDEHHARLGHRAHARDRHPQGDRRAPRATSSRSSWSRRSLVSVSAACSASPSGWSPATSRSSACSRSWPPSTRSRSPSAPRSLCGLFFGIYPAARAARMRPVHALRFE